MLIGKRVIEEEIVEEVIVEVTKKKGLQNLSREFVRDLLFTHLKQNQKASQFLAGKPTKKSAFYKSIIKQLRSHLRKYYGQYRGSADAQRLHELVERLLEGRIIDQHILKDLLALNASTRERFSFYEELYEKLFTITGLPAVMSITATKPTTTTMPTTIIDLGCGLNPFSIPRMRLTKLRYYAYDINEDEIAVLGEFFEYLHSRHPDFQGKAEVLDALHLEELLDLPRAELCFLWKMTDVLDRGKGHRATEAVIKAVPAQWVIVSFPTKTLSGKRMNVPEKRWVGLMCRRLGYEVTVLKFSTEVFYVVRK